MPASPLDRRDAHLTSVPLLLTLLALWLLATLGVRPLLLPDEGRYAEVARAMRLGDALVPTLDGLPFFHKPPLFYWLDLFAMRLVGIGEFAGRFGSALGAWLMGAALLLAMRRWHGPRAAAIALGVLATTPFFFVGGQYANHDMLVGGLITAAVLAWARAVDAPPRVERRWMLAGWALCALALLAKGLIGVVLPMLVVGPWLLAQGRWRQVLKLLHPAGLIVFAVLGLPWLVAMQLRFPGFFDYFIVEQHFRRFALATFNNVHGAWFFLAVMPLATLPWSAWLPAALRRAWGARSPTLGLYAWWTIAIVGFFSIPSSKLVGYALPALAPWCALLALAVAAGGGRAWRWAMGAAALGCVVLVGVAAVKAPNSNRELARALAAAMAPGDRVVMVDEYYYDVPFYARLAQPVRIASDWADPEIARRDNWRKEVADAARFDPTLAAELLQPLAALDRQACGASAAWFIVPAGQAARIAALPGATRAFAGARTELWRQPGRTCH
ncbi:MAG TPA: glycosyltransferase family 39 protein [Burkholderiaceae bacterium]|nr:glycosyltransferase family 39 protein [Burkholderiaceae bacterium]